MTFSSPSNTLVVAPSAAGSASRPIAAYVDSFRDLHISSANLLAWIQTVAALETTTGHVRLGHSPINGVAVKTLGPAAYIRWENFRGENAGSEKTHRAFVDIVVDYVWALLDSNGDPTIRNSDEFIDEMNFLDAITNELLGAIGIQLSSTFAGYVTNWDVPKYIETDQHDETIAHSEARYTIGFGYTT